MNQICSYLCHYTTAEQFLKDEARPEELGEIG